MTQSKFFKDYLLKELNSWRVGGKCRLYTAPRSRDEAVAALDGSFGANEAYILGGGSNILVQDGFIDALVVHTKNMKGLSVLSSDERQVTVEAESGVLTKDLLKFAIEGGLGGLEFLTGIPGSVGGAIWGNAGAQGEGFSELVEEIETIDRDGETSLLNGSRLNWRYRECPLGAEEVAMITKVVLKLKRAAKKQIFEKIKLFADLKKGQPLGRRTAGCVFKNPAGNSAGKLLDEAGCKGLRVGGAVVSPLHANFIENDSNAAASDIFTLSEMCRDRVFSNFGIRLDYEIRFFGSFSEN